MRSQAARDSARALSATAHLMADRLSLLERSDPPGWTGRAREAMAAQTNRMRAEMTAVPGIIAEARKALEAFAESVDTADQMRGRADDIRRDASRLTRRWLLDRPPETSTDDPGVLLRIRAAKMTSEADDLERRAVATAAESARHATHEIDARRLRAGRFEPIPATGILHGFGDLIDDIVETVGNGLGWGWDRTTDVATWAAGQAANIVDGVVRVGDTVIDVGSGLIGGIVDETAATSARARFAADYTLFHLTGSTPDRLPDLSDEYRRTQNVWSYSLIPVIEANGGECTQLDNGIFACLSEGIELPGDLGAIPLKGRGGTTYGEVFIVDDREQYRRVQEPGSPLAEHERNHSIQWAIHGPAAFALLYLQDVALSGNNGRHQYFEQQAGAEAGGYTD